MWIICRPSSKSKWYHNILSYLCNISVYQVASKERLKTATVFGPVVAHAKANNQLNQNQMEQPVKAVPVPGEGLNQSSSQVNMASTSTSSTKSVNSVELAVSAKPVQTQSESDTKAHAEEMVTLRQQNVEVNQKIKTLHERLTQSEIKNTAVLQGLQERLQLNENSFDQKIDNLQKQLQEKEEDTNQKIAELTSRLEQTKREASQEHTALSERLQLKEDELTTINQDFTALQERTHKVEVQQHEKTEMMETQLETQTRQNEQITNQLTIMQKMFDAVKPQWLISRSEIDLSGDELSNGGWGRVVKATFRSKQVAAKCLHHQTISDYNIQQFVREMQISSKCHHPNLLKFLGATLEGDPIILTELMDTNLYDVVQHRELKDHQIIPLLKDIASAINYLHSLSPEPVIHCDISSSNVLLNRPLRSKWVVKLSDFGSANFLWHTSEQSRAPGNPTYAAPEVLSPHSHSEKMDVYSFGVLLFEICSGQAPSLQLRKEVLPSAAAVWPEPYRHFVPLIVSCTRDNKDERPTMSDVLAEL